MKEYEITSDEIRKPPKGYDISDPENFIDDWFYDDMCYCMCSHCRYLKDNTCTSENDKCNYAHN